MATIEKVETGGSFVCAAAALKQAIRTANIRRNFFIIFSK
jgi:hypothetical protein